MSALYGSAFTFTIVERVCRLKTYDFDLEGEEEEIEEKGEKVDNGDDFEGVADFDPLFMFTVINKNYSLRDLLEGIGAEVGGSNMYCPFHPDSLTGKPSAKYFDNDDSLYCFSENKMYSAYHALKLLYGKNMKKVFYKAWKGMNETEREEMMREHGGDSQVDDGEFISPVWRQCRIIMGKFSKGEVSFKQHRNAMYKVIVMMYEDGLRKKMGGVGSGE